MTEIESPFKVEEIDPPENDEAVRDWLAKQISPDNPYLLAHADDGVIWGRKSGDQFLTSHEIAPDISPKLRGLTLWQAFVFGEKSEIRLFRDELENWKAVEISDGEDFFDEDQILWGDKVVKQTANGFTHLRSQVKHGMDHVPPTAISETDINKEKNIFPRLKIRHIIEYDRETGEARIGLSRLVKIGLW